MIFLINFLYDKSCGKISIGNKRFSLFWLLEYNHLIFYALIISVNIHRLCIHSKHISIEWMGTQGHCLKKNRVWHAIKYSIGDGKYFFWPTFQYSKKSWLIVIQFIAELCSYLVCFLKPIRIVFLDMLRWDLRIVFNVDIVGLVIFIMNRFRRSDWLHVTRIFTPFFARFRAFHVTHWN